MSNISQRGFAHIILLILLLLGVGVGVYLALNPTVFKPKANLEANAPFGIISLKKSEAPSKELPQTSGFEANYKFTYPGGAHSGSASGFYPWKLTIDVTQKNGDYPYVALLVTNLQTGTKSIYSTLEPGVTPDQFAFDSDKLNFSHLLSKGDKLQIQLVACVSQGYSNMQGCITDPQTIRFNSVVFTKQDGTTDQLPDKGNPISKSEGSGSGGAPSLILLEGWVVAAEDMVKYLDVYIDGKKYNRAPGDDNDAPFALDGTDKRVTLVEHKEDGVCGPMDPHPTFRNCPNAGFEIVIDTSAISQFLIDGQEHKVKVKAVNITGTESWLSWDKPGGDQKEFIFIKGSGEKVNVDYPTAQIFYVTGNPDDRYKKRVFEDLGFSTQYPNTFTTETAPSKGTNAKIKTVAIWFTKVDSNGKPVSNPTWQCGGAGKTVNLTEGTFKGRYCHVGDSSTRPFDSNEPGDYILSVDAIDENGKKCTGAPWLHDDEVPCSSEGYDHILIKYSGGNNENGIKPSAYKAKYYYDTNTKNIIVEVENASGGYPYVGLKIDSAMYSLTDLGGSKMGYNISSGAPIGIGKHKVQLRANCDYSSQERFQYCAYGYEEIGEDPSPAGKVIKFNEEAIFIPK